ncbi:unnamed protein product [Caenorhabditis auriculariae]|uniref:Palmitoyltransferase n=1 Tax=Caenorhabditis auriculariae TaxID=2777116 RepID=A0A8S1GWJ5_9PELO|nr:unnamed protein product [Caenorhabditis auriculariae]
MHLKLVYFQEKSQKHEKKQENEGAVARGGLRVEDSPSKEEKSKNGPNGRTHAVAQQLRNFLLTLDLNVTLRDLISFLISAAEMRCQPKWWLVVVGWPLAFAFWFQVIVVLFASRSYEGFGRGSLLFFHFLWIVIICSWFSTVFTPPRKIQLAEKQKHKNYCKKCEFPKPDRAHHCSVCKRCVARMDHHCPVLQTCIHQQNHKFFLLFLLWPLVLAVFTVYHGWSVLSKALVCCWNFCELTGEEHSMASGVSNAVVVGMSVLYLLRYQIPNLLRNMTIIEEARDDDRYDTGSWWKNVRSVMGGGFSSVLPVGNPAL